MKSKALACICAAVIMSGCVETTGGIFVATSTSAPAALSTSGPEVARFNRVVARMEGVAEQACRQRVRSGVDCDFKIVLDTDPRQPSNAYQSLDRNNRPVLTFTAALLKDMQNDHELAFVLGHEAAHHIAGHLGEMPGNVVRCLVTQNECRAFG